VPHVNLLHAIVFAAFSVLLTFPASAADAPGSKDHPLVGRYTGSEIVFYKQSSYDEAVILQAPFNWRELQQSSYVRSGPEWLKLEGGVTTIRYTVATKRSSLEVIRNYEAALKAKGFQVSFQCSDNCITGPDREPFRMGELMDPDNRVPHFYSEKPRYLLAKLNRPQGLVYVAIFIAEFREQTTAIINVVETKEMDSNQIVVLSAKEMDTEIVKSGSVNIYTIFFDYDKAVVKPESKPTLDEIAKMFSGEASLKLKIVGHTDNQGSHNYNMDLSRRRAAAVVAALNSGYGISTGRMSSDGAGFMRPVAPNTDESGRAKNRRVELIRE
jgi:outer membrane protein OmpA-like peptidoglycan-associated protein